MGLHSHANARDANEPEIVEAFEALRCSVDREDTPCDLVVGEDFKGVPRTHLVEGKSGPKARSTKTQRKFKSEHKGEVHIVWDIIGVCALVDSWGGPSAIVSRGCR